MHQSKIHSTILSLRNSLHPYLFFLIEKFHKKTSSLVEVFLSCNLHFWKDITFLDQHTFKSYPAPASLAFFAKIEAREYDHSPLKEAAIHIYHAKTG